jgi:hypothetical protein
MTSQTSRPTSALAALTGNEKATVFDELLAIRPDLRELAETHAARLISNEDRSAVAGDVEYALLSRDIEELNSRAGYQPGQGYVHPVEAAPEILDEELEPFLRDLERRAKLGMKTAAVELAVGILLGLYECRCRQRNAVGVLPGLRPRTGRRRGRPVPDARRRPAHCRAVRSPSRVERCPAAARTSGPPVAVTARAPNGRPSQSRRRPAGTVSSGRPPEQQRAIR